MNRSAIMLDIELLIERESSVSHNESAHSAQWRPSRDLKIRYTRECSQCSEERHLHR